MKVLGTEVGLGWFGIGSDSGLRRVAPLGAQRAAPLHHGRQRRVGTRGPDSRGEAGAGVGGVDLWSYFEHRNVYKRGLVELWSYFEHQNVYKSGVVELF